MDTALRARLSAINRLLVREYGRPGEGRSDPIEVLVATILSQNTSDVNSGRAYASLTATFSDWEALADAPVAAIARAIRSGGLANIKARRIKAVLRGIRKLRGSIELDFLGTMPTNDAREMLIGLPGVGPKTAAVVLHFCFGRPVFPVDTHIHRLSRRLGLAPPKATPEQVSTAISAAIKPAEVGPLHLNMIAHGRAVCTAHSPKCLSCVLLRLCLRAGLPPLR